jgi:hypothetical protein
MKYSDFKLTEVRIEDRWTAFYIAEVDSTTGWLFQSTKRITIYRGFPVGHWYNANTGERLFPQYELDGLFSAWKARYGIKTQGDIEGKV